MAPDPVKSKGGKGGLGKKVGPLPVWAWAGIAIVGAVVVYLKFKSGPAVSGSGSDVGSSVGLVTGGDAAQNAYGSGGPAQNSAPIDGLSPGVQAALSDYQGGLRDTVLTSFDEGNSALANILSSYGGTQAASSTASTSSAKATTAAAPAKPKSKTVQATQQQATHRYFTFAPGTKLSVAKAKGYSAADIAPAGARFKQGKGYYVL